jgi:GMP synthase-like glutamine amidotransferase
VSDARALVIENDPTDDIRRLGVWLTEAGLGLETLRAHAGDKIPETLDGYDALIVMGGEQRAYADEDGARDAAWLPKLESLLRKATRNKIATLGVCLGGQLLASAHGGVVERSPSGPEIGAKFVARRDAAEQDPLWRYIPFIPDVFQWHHDEITALPAGATLLAASPNYPNQAFRIGERAWGLQFHIECDVDMIASWAADGERTLDDLGLDAESVVEACAAVMDDVEEIWQPFAARFAAAARGELSTAPTRVLPLLGH